MRNDLKNDFGCMQVALNQKVLQTTNTVRAAVSVPWLWSIE